MLDKLFSKRPEIPKDLQGIFYRKNIERFLRTQGFTRAEARYRAYLLKEIGMTQREHIPKDQ